MFVHSNLYHGPVSATLILTFALQARERLTSYRGKMTVKLCWRVNDGPVETEIKDCGQIPIMIRVSVCVSASFLALNMFLLSLFDVT